MPTADLSVVSLDERIRTNSGLLGIRVLPPHSGAAPA